MPVQWKRMLAKSNEKLNYADPLGFRTGRAELRFRCLQSTLLNTKVEGRREKNC